MADDLAARLARDGFKRSTGRARSLSEEADTQGRRDNGPYEILHVFRKDDVEVVVEQNTQLGVQMPAVAIIEGPGGRVAANPDDHELVAQMAAAMGGEGASA